MRRGMGPVDCLDDKIPFGPHCYSRHAARIDHFWRFRFDSNNNIYSVIAVRRLIILCIAHFAIVPPWKTRVSVNDNIIIPTNVMHEKDNNNMFIVIIIYETLKPHSRFRLS